MQPTPAIRIAKVDYGPFADAPRLNPKLSPTHPLLLATLDIRWDPEDPVAQIARLERSLLAISPRFVKHECRGPDAYHVFRGDGDGGDASGSETAPPPGPDKIEGRLALAHLIEHAVIDFQCAITSVRRCSGITAAYRTRKDRFDLMVECPDRRVGRASLALALAWVTSALGGRVTGPAERDVLDAARLVYTHPERSLTPVAAARALTCPEDRAAQALAALCDVGYVLEAPCTVNLSGIPAYRLAES